MKHVSNICFITSFLLMKLE